jgi:hypothetical protein
MFFSRSVPALMALVVFSGGCSNDPLGRQAVSGAVKIDGAPLPRGNIGFQPMDGQPTSGGAAVSDGKYSVPRDGGLVAGKYRVVINAPVPGSGGKVDETTLPGDPPAPPKELIPPDWNVNSQQTIEVKKEGPFVFDFDVTTKKE